jgi:Na+/H+-dicarboxylate symporter
MSRTGWILLALAGGVLAGLGLRQAGPQGLHAVALLTPIGTLWLNALRMTLVPLIFCLMTTGVASIANTAGGGRLIGTTVGVFIVLLIIAAATGAVAGLGLGALWPLHPVGAALTASQAKAAEAPAIDIVSQVIALIPLNPIAAAAEAAMTPLIVFAAILGAAVTRLPEEQRKLLTGVLQAGGDAMLVIVDWVLRAAPAGIFVLALGAVAKAGIDMAAGLLQYVLMLSIVLALGLLLALLIGMFSGVGPMRFLRAATGPLALAASTQSSMACLPALVKAADEDLDLPPAASATILPLAVTVFRFGNVFGVVSAGLFGAYLFGVHPSAGQTILAVGVAVLTNIGVMGLPGAAVLLAAYGPVFLALGAPLEALTLLIAVFTLPDIVDTSTNVVADLAVGAVIVRLMRKPVPSPEIEAVVEPA